MPIYQYACKKCEAEFERIAPVTKIPKRPQCPECKSQKTEQIITTCFWRMQGGTGAQSSYHQDA